jgi:hypothetical protein
MRMYPEEGTTVEVYYRIKIATKNNGLMYLEETTDTEVVLNQLRYHRLLQESNPSLGVTSVEIVKFTVKRTVEMTVLDA